MAVRFAALRTGRALLPRSIIFLLLVAGRIKQIEKKKVIHLIGSRNRDLPARSIVPQPVLNRRENEFREI
jgi:hypothetical protein